MADPAASIVSSKVRPPPPLRGGVPRSRLTDLLRAGFDGGASVALICAPAGSGKTTVLVEHLADLPAERVAWFEADEYDNEPIRFWAHLITSLERSDPVGPGDVRRSAAGNLALAPARTGDWAAMIERLVAWLEGEDRGERWLVIDDYHTITTDVVHDHLDLLIRWLPSSVRLILSTRLDPPLPTINRLRLQGRLVELRADRLAFDADEAARLMAVAGSGDLSAEATARLVERTEGWAAGLYLAALSVRGAPDPQAALQRFTGDERLVADYLRTELLATVGQDTRRFLLRTSVLDELDGDLCDAVLADPTDGHDDPVGSARRLRELGRGHLLLVPLDERGQRYRHHHLISHWLRTELAMTEPELLPVLHRRAAACHLARGQAMPAHRHARAAGDVDLVRSVVERCWRDLLRSARYVTLRAWLDDLGPVVEASGALCLARAQLARNTGEPAAVAATWLERAATLIDPEDSALTAQLHINRMVHERMVGDLGAAEDHGRRALATVTDPVLIPEARSLLGATLAQLGHHDEAIDHLTGAIGDLERLEATAGRSELLTEVFARSHLPLPLYEAGQRRRARRAAADALDRAARTDLAESAILGNARSVLGQLAIDDGRLDEADQHLRSAATDGERSRSITCRLHALLGLARLAAASRHGLEARRLLAEAREVVESMPDPGRLAGLVDAATRQYLGLGADGARAGLVGGEPTGPLPLVEDLTERELAVLRLLPSDLSLRDIGSELFVSHNTVKGHVKAIYRKLAVNTRDGAVARSRDLGLLQP